MSNSCLDDNISVALQYSSLPWYALQVRARYEKAVAHNLRSRGYVDFLPLHICTHRWSDRIQKVELPLFPSYVFCRFDARERCSILSVPGVISIVGIGKKPQPVDEGEMTALQTVVRSGLLLQPWPFLKAGHRVVIQDGPLRNVEGVLSEVRDHDQLIVHITLLRRAVAVTIDRAWIRPLDTHESLERPLKKGPAPEYSQATTLLRRNSGS